MGADHASFMHDMASDPIAHSVQGSGFQVQVCETGESESQVESLTLTAMGNSMHCRSEDRTKGLWLHRH